MAELDFYVKITKKIKQILRSVKYIPKGFYLNGNIGMCLT